MKTMITTAVCAAAIAASAFASTGHINGRFSPGDGFSWTLGSKVAAGFYLSEEGRCAVTLMIGDALDEAAVESPGAGSRIRLTLDPAETAGITGSAPEELLITCGPGARHIVLGIANEGTM